MHALQDMGEALVALDPKRLAQLAAEAPLPARLVDAIVEARSITAWGARKRQLQYVGRLMRDVDPEPIRRRLEQWAHGHAIDSARQHALEQWRDRLIADPAALDLLAAALAAARPSALSRADRKGPRRAGTRATAARVSRALSRIEGARSRTPLNRRHAFELGHRKRISMESLLIGLVSISDRASSGVYEDKGIPGLNDWFTAALRSPWRMESRLIPDEQPQIERTLVELVDTVGCHLVLTTGGTGPAPRDVTPEATLAVAHKVLPGFGEQMRQVSLKYVPTAILSRQVGVDPRPVADPQSARPAEGDQGDARRDLSGGSLLHRPHRRPVHRDERRGLQGVPAEVGGQARSGLSVATAGLAPRASMRDAHAPQPRRPIQRDHLVAGDREQHDGAARQRRCGRTLADAEPRPQRPEHGFEQRQQRDLGRRQVAARDDQHHAGDGELEHAERGEQREVVRARLERKRERQRDQRGKRTSQQHGRREIDGPPPLAQRHDVDGGRDRDAERDQRTGQASTQARRRTSMPCPRRQRQSRPTCRRATACATRASRGWPRTPGRGC